MRVHFSDNLGRVILAFGAVSLVVGVATYNTFGTVLSAVTLSLGITLVFYGMTLQLGMFSSGLRSLTGSGMLLICVSVGLFALSFAAWQFMSITSMQVREIFYDGRESIRRWQILFEYDRPYLWISDLFLKSGLGLFLAGIGIRIIKLLRP